jgi:hypothetical protein
MIKIATMTEPGLQDLALRVPPGIREVLPEWELTTRCMFAAQLYSEASLLEAGAAEATRLKASRVLSSLPVEQYLARIAYFDAELRVAARDEDDEAAARAFVAILKLQRLNIYPEDVLSVIQPKIAAEMAFGNRAASRAVGLPKARVRG